MQLTSCYGEGEFNFILPDVLSNLSLDLLVSSAQLSKVTRRFFRWGWRGRGGGRGLVDFKYI